MKTILLFILILFVISCTTEIPFPEYEGEQKLVIGCLFGADSVFSVHVSHTQAVFDTVQNYVNNADVELWSNGIFLEKLQRVGNGHYKTSTEKGVPFKPYTLKVSAEGFASVEATDSIPEKQIIISANVALKVGYDNEQLNSFSTMNFLFTNNTYKKCYYEDFLAFNGYTPTNYTYDENGNGYFQDTIFGLNMLLPHIKSEEAFVEVEDINFFDGDKTLVFNNELMNSSETSMVIRFFPGNTGSPTVSYLTLYHSCISKNNYLYKTSLKRQMLEHGKYDPTSVDEISELFSFGAAKEVFSNIRGGYGIFAAYTVDTVMFPLHEQDLYK